MERAWHIGARDHWRGGSIFPRKLGPFVRAAANGGRDLVVGQWGLIPFFAKTPKLTYQTNNARSSCGRRGDSRPCKDRPSTDPPSARSTSTACRAAVEKGRGRR